MAASDSTKKAVKKYQSKLDETKIWMKKGKKAQYRAMAERAGKSLSKFITDILDEMLNQEKQE